MIAILVTILLAALALLGVFLFTEAKTFVPLPAGFTFKDKYDALFWGKANAHSLPPVLLKSIAWVESNWNAMALNPERKGLSPSLIRKEILQSGDGGDSVLARYKINPSIGLMQVRVTTARDFIRVNPIDLFDPATNVEAGARFLSWLKRNGVNVEADPDAYNTGLAGFRSGIRNRAYQSAVLEAQRQFQNDFPPGG